MSTTRLHQRQSLDSSIASSFIGQQFGVGSSSATDAAAAGSVNVANLKRPTNNTLLAPFYMYTYMANTLEEYKHLPKNSFEIPITNVFKSLNPKVQDLYPDDKYKGHTHFCMFYMCQLPKNKCSEFWINGICTNHWEIAFNMNILLEQCEYKIPNCDQSKARTVIKPYYSDFFDCNTILFPFFSSFDFTDSSIDETLSQSFIHLDAEKRSIKEDLIKALRCFLFNDEPYNIMARKCWIHDMAKIYQDLSHDTILHTYKSNSTSQVANISQLWDLCFLDIPFIATIGTNVVGQSGTDLQYIRQSNVSICILQTNKDDFWFQSGLVLRKPIKTALQNEFLCSNNSILQAVGKSLYRTVGYEMPTIQGRMGTLYNTAILINDKPEHLLLSRTNCTTTKAPQ